MVILRYNDGMEKNTKNARERLIDATFDEVYEKGYQGASLTDILAKAGVHKGSMYHFFANKKEMTMSALSEKMSERFTTKYGKIVEMDGGYIGALFETLLDTSNRDFRRGCPLANIVQEMSNLDDDFDKLSKEFYRNFRGAVQAVLDKAVQAGELKGCNTETLALFVTVVIEGAILAAKATGEADDYVSAIGMLKMVFGNL